MGLIGPMGLMRPMGPMGLIGLISRMGLIGLMGLLAGCSKDSAEQEPVKLQEVISFSPALPDEESATRADTPLSDLTHTFTAWAFKNDGYDSSTDTYTSYQTVMPNYVVNWTANSAYTTTTNTNNWEYVGQPASVEQTIKYWDFDANAYRFFGVAAGNTTNEATTAYNTVLSTGAYQPNSANEANGAYGFSATVDASTDATIAAAPYFSQLWFSTGNTTDYPDKQFGRPVQLRFIKPFARVRFMFTFVEGLTFGREKLHNISFHPTVTQSSPSPSIATAGTVTVSYPLKGSDITESWTATPTSGISAFTIDYYEAEDPSTLPAGVPADNLATTWPNTPGKWYTVLPAFNQGTYTLEVAVVTDEVKTAVIPAEYMVWKPGYEYTYKFKITESGGITMDIIQVAINDWSNKRSSEHIVYNW